MMTDTLRHTLRHMLRHELPAGRLRVLEAIERLCAKGPGYSPSVKEICQEVGLKSTASVQRHIDALFHGGWITRLRGTPRTIRPAGGDAPTSQPPPPGLSRSAASAVAAVPILGRGAAGSPIGAVSESVPEIMLLPRELCHGGESGCFILTVNGDSMIEEGILSGDLAVVRQQRTATNGSLVVARVNGSQVTLRRFYRERSHIRLQPANAAMEPMRVTDCQILGVVVSLIRTRL